MKYRPGRGNSNVSKPDPRSYLWSHNRVLPQEVDYYQHTNTDFLDYLLESS